FVNDEFIKQSGYSLEDYNNLSHEELYNLIYAEDRERLNKNYEEWVKTGYRGVYRIDYRIINKNSKILWLDTFMYAEFDETGKVKYINQICIDITERKAAELAL